MFGKLKLAGNILIGAVVVLVWGCIRLVKVLRQLDQGVPYARLQLQLWNWAWVLIAGTAVILVALTVAIIQKYRATKF
ncbi:hypothetical protein [Lactiplantibacillus songbeiensis]|uniref:Integral membrane protein n=1 Tax=Lactiplantibacillus songbeiensis TaxID=2559920 RepID=A0ABW4BXF9_9LACO|nr:hypothetical protein [Lactiplantibacillus songbeiensis]